MTALDGLVSSDLNRLKTLRIGRVGRMVQGNRASSGSCFAGALASTGGQPGEHIALRVPTPPSTGRAEMARAITTKPVLIYRIGMDAENLGDLFCVEGTPFGRVPEQL